MLLSSLLPELPAQENEAPSLQAENHEYANTQVGLNAQPAPGEGRALRRHSHPRLGRVKNPRAPSNWFLNLTRKSTSVCPLPLPASSEKYTGFLFCPLHFNLDDFKKPMQVQADFLWDLLKNYFARCQWSPDPLELYLKTHSRDWPPSLQTPEFWDSCISGDPASGSSAGMSISRFQQKLPQLQELLCLEIQRSN